MDPYQYNDDASKSLHESEWKTDEESYSDDPAEEDEFLPVDQDSTAEYFSGNDLQHSKEGYQNDSKFSYNGSSYLDKQLQQQENSNDDSFSFDENEERDAEQQLLAALKEEQELDQQESRAFSTPNKAPGASSSRSKVLYSSASRRTPTATPHIQPTSQHTEESEYDTMSDDDSIRMAEQNGTFDTEYGDESTSDHEWYQSPSEGNNTTSAQLRYSTDHNKNRRKNSPPKYPARLIPRSSLSANKNAAFRSRAHLKKHRQKKSRTQRRSMSAQKTTSSGTKNTPSVMTPRSHYYDRLRRIKRVHSSPKFLFRGGVGLSTFPNMGMEKFGDNLVSNYDLLDKRKKLMKKYTNVRSDPYQPTGKYEEPKQFLHERGSQKQSRSSSTPNSKRNSNTFERRKNYGKKVWNHRVKQEENKYKQIKRAQTLNELDALRQEWIQLNQWMKQLDPSKVQQTPALDNNQSLADEMDDIQNQLWPNSDLRPRSEVVSTENHRLLNSSLLELGSDDEEEHFENDHSNQTPTGNHAPQQLFPAHHHSVGSPSTTSHNFASPSMQGGLSPSSPAQTSMSSPSRSGSMEPSHASELLEKAESVLRRTSDLFSRFDDTIASEESKTNGTSHHNSSTSILLQSSEYHCSDEENNLSTQRSEETPVSPNMSAASTSQKHSPSLELQQDQSSEEPEISFTEPIPPPCDRDLPYIFQFFPAEYVFGTFSLVSSKWNEITRRDKMWHILYRAKYGVSLSLVDASRNAFMHRLRLERENTLRGAALFHEELQDTYSDLSKFSFSTLSESQLEQLYHLNQLDRVRRDISQRVDSFLSESQWQEQPPFSILARELFPDLIFTTNETESSVKKAAKENLTQNDLFAHVLIFDKSKEYEEKLKAAEEQLNESKMIVSAHPRNKKAKKRAHAMNQIPQQENQLKRLMKRLEKEQLETDSERTQFFSDVPFYKQVLVKNWRSFIDSRKDLFSHYQNWYNIIVTRFESDTTVDVTGEFTGGIFNSEIILFDSQGEEVHLECSVKTAPDSSHRSGVSHQFNLMLKQNEDSFCQLFTQEGLVNESSAQKLCSILLGSKYNPDDEIHIIGCVWFILMVMMPTEVLCQVSNDEFLFQLYTRCMKYDISFDPFTFHSLKKDSISRPRISHASGNNVECQLPSSFLPRTSQGRHLFSSSFSSLDTALIYRICEFLRYQDMIPGCILLNKTWNAVLRLHGPFDRRDNQQSKFWLQMFSNELGAPLEFVHKAPKQRFAALWKKITNHRFLPHIDLTVETGNALLSNKTAMSICSAQIASRLDILLNHPDAVMEFFDFQVEGPPSASHVDATDVWRLYLQTHRHTEFLKYFSNHPCALFIHDCKYQVAPRKSAQNKVELVSYLTHVSLHYRGMELQVRLTCEYHPQRKRSSPYTFKAEYKGGKDALQQFLDTYLTHELNIVQSTRISDDGTTTRDSRVSRMHTPSSHSKKAEAASSPAVKKRESAVNFAKFLQVMLRFSLMPFDFILKKDGMENSEVYRFVREMHKEWILSVICSSYNKSNKLPYFKSIRPSGNAE